MIIPSKLTYRLKIIPKKSQEFFPPKSWLFASMVCKVSSLIKDLLEKKNNVERLALPYIQAYNKGTVFKTRDNK